MGRPKGSKNKPKQVPATANGDPLAYLLKIMNDPTIEQRRRDRAAIAALPYVNRRLDLDRIGKKEQAEADAKKPDPALPLAALAASAFDDDERSLN